MTNASHALGLSIGTSLDSRHARHVRRQSSPTRRSAAIIAASLLPGTTNATSPDAPPGGCPPGGAWAYWRFWNPMTVFGLSTTGAAFPVTVRAPKIALDFTVVPPLFFWTATSAMA